MWQLQPTLSGTVVRLEPLTEEHRDPLWQAAQDRRAWEWWTVRTADTRKGWDAWFEYCLQAPLHGESYHFATILQRSGTPVGSTSFCTVREDDFGIEIGWTWLHPSVWGSGVNTDAKYLQLEYAFETLKCIRVEWDTDAENRRSRAALTNLGAQLEGVFRDFHIREVDQSRRSSAIFSMLDHEWPAVKAMLQQRIASAR